VTHLFSPLTLREVTFAHRAWMSPMMQFAAVPEGADTGTPTDWHLQHLGSRAVAGAALVMVEATAVDPAGRSSVYDLGLWNDRQAESFRRITSFINAQGAVPGIQLVHAGRKASTGRPWPDDEREPDTWPTFGASPVPFGRLPSPAELTAADVSAVVAGFADAAARAAAAGFRVLELHGAHGYLIHQFLSPHSNKRTDHYGGPLENRMRFALEVTGAVRRNWPAQLPLFFRVSATDWLAGDTDDLIDVSSGGSAPDAPIPVAPSYQIPLSACVREAAQIPTAGVGLITEPGQADSIIAEGQADAVFLARILLRNPAWIRQAAEHLGHPLPYPPNYSRAFK
jgi:2,4-dienoyl-CoA reductase-like NADH-dependent reductase (Old Yellow Enzyme family)